MTAESTISIQLIRIMKEKQKRLERIKHLGFSTYTGTNGLKI